MKLTWVDEQLNGGVEIREPPYTEDDGEVIADEKHENKITLIKNFNEKEIEFLLKYLRKEAQDFLNYEYDMVIFNCGRKLESILREKFKSLVGFNYKIKGDARSIAYVNNQIISGLPLFRIVEMLKKLGVINNKKVFEDIISIRNRYFHNDTAKILLGLGYYDIGKPMTEDEKRGLATEEDAVLMKANRDDSIKMLRSTFDALSQFELDEPREVKWIKRLKVMKK
jgi:hypothetical protein